MEIYYKLIEVIFPVFLVIGIGYYLGKKDKEINTNLITSFAANIGSPAMIIYALNVKNISFNVFVDYFVYYLIAIFGFSIIGIIFLFFLKSKDIIRELPPFMMPNTGNMGYPICLFAYGSEGLGVAAAITSLIILFHFTVGVFLADRKFSLNVILKSPPFYTILFSVILLYFDLELPIFIENTTFLLMYATIFLILISLGIALTRLKVFSLKRSIISSIGRVIIGPVIGIVIIYYFDLSGFAAGVLLIQCSMPSAILNFLVGSMYSPKENVDNVASMIFVSTVISFVTIPIIVFISLSFFP
tara:strand:- start:962 stop:1864 length:903 start_codon:yes stop_codon:yes gene_type:complete